LSTAYKAKEYEFLRLTSLGVIGALVKVRNLRKLRMAMNFCLDFRGEGREDGGKVINLDFWLHIPIFLIK
jgi:hypothetical protein